MDRFDLEGKSAVVTGGGRGIGLATCRALTQAGASCAIWDRDPTALEEATATFDDANRILGVAVNVTDPASVEHAAAKTCERFGKIDLLVNNAGIAGVSKKLWECTPDEWRDVMEIDLWGVFLCCHAIVPRMLETGFGRIVNVAPIAGKEGNPNASHYSAAKAGVIGMTKSLGKELAQTNIRVNCITPAVIETDILKQVSEEHLAYMLSRIPMGRAGKPEEVAAMIVWLCSESCSFTTGAVMDISGGRATY